MLSGENHQQRNIFDFEAESIISRRLNKVSPTLGEISHSTRRWREGCAQETNTVTFGKFVLLFSIPVERPKPVLGLAGARADRVQPRNRYTWPSRPRRRHTLYQVHSRSIGATTSSLPDLCRVFPDTNENQIMSKEPARNFLCTGRVVSFL